MPRGDGTGPVGMGSMSGRAAGYCAGYDVPGYMHALPGRGYGGGYGRGMFGQRRKRGFGRGMGRDVGPGYYGPMPYGNGPAYPQADPQSERQFLENDANALQEKLEDIRKRLAELEAQEEKKE